MKTIRKIENLLRAYNSHCLNQIYFEQNSEFMRASLEDDCKFDIFIKLREMQTLHPIKYKIAFLLFNGKINKKIAVFDK